MGGEEREEEQGGEEEEEEDGEVTKQDRQDRTREDRSSWEILNWVTQVRERWPVRRPAKRGSERASEARKARKTRPGQARTGDDGKTDETRRTDRDLT